LQKRAFSLIELLIVIVIMGVVYTMAISNFSRLNDESSSLSLKNLKEYLSSLDYEEEAKLVCLDDCSVCDIYLDGNKTQSIEGLLDSSVKSYRYEQSYGFVEQDPEVLFNADGVEESVCFTFSVDNRGVADQVLVEYKENYYDMSTYLTTTQVYKTLEDARETRENLQNEVLQ